MRKNEIEVRTGKQGLFAYGGSSGDVLERYEAARDRIRQYLNKTAAGIESGVILEKWFRGPRWDVRLLCDQYGFGEKKVLDIGCAYGSSLLLWGDGSEGIEANGKCAMLLERIGRRVHAINVEDGIWKAIPEKSFDAVFSSNLIEHLVAPHLFFANIYRVLNDDGVLAIQHPVVVPVGMGKIAGIISPLKRLIGREGWHAGEHINFFTPRTICLSLQRAGFVVKEQYGGHFVRWPFLGKLIVPVAAKCLSICEKSGDYRYVKKRRDVFDPEWGRKLLEQYRVGQLRL